MAVRWAVQNGNWSDTATWNGGTLPGNGDDVYANGKVVTIDIDLVGQYRPASLWNRANNSYGIVGGGWFEVPQSRQIGESGSPVNVYGTNLSGTNYGCVRVTVPAPGVVTVYGNIYAGTYSSGHGLENNNTGTVNVIGEVRGGANSCIGIKNGSGTINVIGNVYGVGDGAVGITNSGIGVVNVTGNVEGGSGGVAYGISNTSTGSVNVTGNVYGGLSSNAYGIFSSGSGTVTVNGVEHRGRTAPAIYNTGGAFIIVHGDCYADSSPAVYSTAGTCWINGNRYGGYSGSGAGIHAVVAYREGVINPENVIIRAAKSGGIPGTFSGDPAWFYGAGVSPQGHPAESDVRYGVQYGPNLELTGTCRVPAPQSVLYGVPVDNTVGTATVDAASIAAAVWNAQRSSYSASGTFGAVSEWSGGSLNDIILIGSGTVSSDTNNSPIQFKTNLSGSANKFIGLFLKFSSTANAANEIREIVGFDQATGVVTLNKALTTTPNSGDTFYLMGYSGR